MGNKLTRLYRQRNALFFGLLAFGIVILCLFAGGTVGLSDNGDFSRAMKTACLTWGDVRPSRQFVAEYSITLPRDGLFQSILCILFGSQGLSVYPSLQALPLRLSVVFQLLCNALTGQELSYYHIASLGLLYAFLYALGISLFFRQLTLPRLWADCLLKLAGLLLLCDFGYTAYFNSFYGEALEHIALIWCAAALLGLLNGRFRLRNVIFLSAAALVYGWSKFFCIPPAMLLCAAALFLCLRAGAGFSRLLPLFAALLALASVWSLVPEWMDQDTSYNAVFYGIVRECDEDEAREYLAELGLDPVLSELRDTNAYVDGVSEKLDELGMREAVEAVSKVDIIFFYLRHPARLYNRAVLAAAHSGMIRPWYLPNKSGGLMQYAQRFSLWGNLRNKLALDSLGGNAAVIALGCLFLALSLRKKEKCPESIVLPLLLAAGLLYSFLLPVLVNGEGDIAKHQFTYIELLDLSLFAVLALVLQARPKQQPLCSALALLLAAALLLPLPIRAVSAIASASRKHDTVEPGACLALGQTDGKPLLWLVTDVSGDNCRLICLSDIGEAAFDDADCDWRQSDIRAYLNGDFLRCFSAEEQALLQEQNHTLLLCRRDKSDAGSGTIDFPCDHIAELCARGAARSYQTAVCDLVRLPDVSLVAQMAAQKMPLDTMWLETPYFYADTLCRYVGTDGHVYFGDVRTLRPIHPVVTIADFTVLSGTGREIDPFVIG